MSDEEKRLRRLSDSAEDLGRQLATTFNFPLEEHIDLVTLEGLRDTFGIDPTAASTDDLARIIMVRDALYNVVEQVNELDEQGQHSINQLLHALNRLYVDAEAYLKLRSDLVERATRALEAQQNTRQIPISPTGPIGQTVVNASTDVINHVSITDRSINIYILNGIKVDMFRNLRVQIRRLSASAFVVNVKVDAQVMFEGTVQFLTAAADRVLADLRKMAESLKESLGSAEAIVKSLDNVIKSGTKFVKVIGSLIQDALGEDAEVTEVKLTLRNTANTKAITCATMLRDGTAALGGRNGSVYLVAPSGQSNAHTVERVGHIHAIAELESGKLALGTSDGMTIWTPRFQGGITEHSRQREKIIALAPQKLHGTDTAIAATSVGELTRWWVPGGKPEHFTTRQGHPQDIAIPPWDLKRLSRKIIAVTTMNDQIVVAGENSLIILDNDLQLEREIPFGKSINAVAKLNATEIVVAGDGLLGIVDISHGYHARLLNVPSTAQYVSVAVLKEGLVAVCNESGHVYAIDLKSGAELGEIDTQMLTRGLIVVGKFLVAYGGPWNGIARSLAFILWEEKIAAPVA